MTAPEVVVAGVHVRFGNHHVLDEVSLRVPAGSTTVIIGPSGVGKTTLLKTLVGLLEPDDGEVTIDGRPITDVSSARRHELRRGLGVLLGGSSLYDASLFGSMTAWQNVEYPLQVTEHDRTTTAQRAWDRLAEFELGDHAERYPHELSGGLKRRVALARALVNDPHLIVLDDPGLALDVVNRDRITESIRRARQLTDATMIVACHDIELARALADEVVVLLAGRVAARGSAHELLDGIHDADDLDARFDYRSQFGDGDDDSRSLIAADRRAKARREILIYSVIFTLVAAAMIIAVATGNFTFDPTGPSHH